MGGRGPAEFSHTCAVGELLLGFDVSASRTCLGGPARGEGLWGLAGWGDMQPQASHAACLPACLSAHAFASRLRAPFLYGRWR